MSARVALVTGADGAIGTAIRRRLSADGWTVVGYDVDRLDVTDGARFRAVVDDVVTTHGGLTALVNNAGFEGVVEPLPQYPEDVFEKVMRTNVHGVFLGMRAALPAMYEAGRGAVVNVASTSGIRGRKHLAGYVASKHAVLGLTRTAAYESVGTGVRVNAVLPGAIESRMTQAINDGSETGAIQRAVAAPYGSVDDVAATVAYLVSDDSRHLNGAEIVVDGGATVG